MREQLQSIIESYILYREQLTCLFLLIDSRHEPQKIDLDFMTWLGENGIPFGIIFTKLDKMSAVRAKENLNAYQEKLHEQWEELPPILPLRRKKSWSRRIVEL